MLIGVDLGGTNCRAALVDLQGVVRHTLRISTDIHDGLESFLSRFEALGRELIGRARESGTEVMALGVGAPGVISSDGKVEVSPNLAPLNGVPFASRLSKMFGLPVTVMNDANAIAVGETRQGAGREFSSCLTLTLGTGVGGGLFLDGKLWEGADGSAGEVGHMMVEPQGRPCGCGSRGCLEQYASATGLVKNAVALLAAGGKGLLAEKDPEELTSDEVASAARRGDSLALEAMAEGGIRLGQALAGVANLLNLDGVVIGGGASASLDLMLPSLNSELVARGFAIPVRRLRIVRAQLGDEAGIIGAARQAYERLDRKSI